jgi:hypothetical protein
MAHINPFAVRKMQQAHRRAVGRVSRRFSFLLWRSLLTGKTKTTKKVEVTWTNGLGAECAEVAVGWPVFQY